MSAPFEDILYEVRNHVAWITINRPEKMNAFRGTTCDEIIKALNKAGYDRDVGCIVLAGAGDRAFCTGGDQSAHDGNYDGRGTIGLPMEELHTAIRDVPKPVIARVQGFAIGGGNVLATICDLTICSDKAVFGQVGPKMGSVDPGYGTAFLVSILVRWPLIGVAMGFLTGDGTSWRQDPDLRRVYAAASWIWVGLFYSRLIVQTPMYLAGWVEVQGIVKIIMGYPLFLAAAYFTYRVLQPVFRRKREEKAAQKEHDADDQA